MQERKKYDLAGKVEEYPGVFRWNGAWYILVKDGEHYPIARKKMDIMAKECRGKWDEIVKWYKPRKKREKDPNAPQRKSKAQIYIEAMEREQNPLKYEISSTPVYVNPKYQDKLDGHKYDDRGWRVT